MPAFCGIDVGLKTHAVCLLDSEGRILEEFTITNDRTGFEGLTSRLSRMTKCALEPTGVYSINLYLYLKQRKYDARFVDTRSSSHFRKALNRNQKADRKDAVALAKYRIVYEDLTRDGTPFLDRMFSQPKSEAQRELSRLAFQNRVLSAEVRQVKTRIKRLIDLRFPEAGQLYKDRASVMVCRVLSHSKKDVLCGRVPKVPARIIECVRGTIGQFDLHRDDFCNLVQQHKELDHALNECETQVLERVRQVGYESMLGLACVGPVTAATLITEALPVSRFIRTRPGNGLIDKRASLRAFKSYCGLGVTRDQSGMHEGGQKLSRGGNLRLKSVLFTMARGMLSIRPAQVQEYDHTPLRPSKYQGMFARYRDQGKKGMWAIVKMMDKIATDLFFILRDLEHDQVSRAASGTNQSMPRTAPRLVEEPVLQTTSP